MLTLYRHYKGGLYVKLGHACWHEPPGDTHVVYRCCDNGVTYVRPLAEFDAFIDGNLTRRFTAIGTVPGDLW